MNFILIITVMILQSYLFYLLRKRKTFGLQWVLSIALLLFYFLLLPELLIYFSGPANQECGMPVVALYLGLWIFGGGITIVSTVLGYLAWFKWKQKEGHIQNYGELIIFAEKKHLFWNMIY